MEGTDYPSNPILNGKVWILTDDDDDYDEICPKFRVTMTITIQIRQLWSKKKDVQVL